MAVRSRLTVRSVDFKQLFGKRGSRAPSPRLSVPGHPIPLIEKCLSQRFSSWSPSSRPTRLPASRKARGRDRSLWDASSSTSSGLRGDKQLPLRALLSSARVQDPEPTCVVLTAITVLCPRPEGPCLLHRANSRWKTPRRQRQGRPAAEFGALKRHVDSSGWRMPFLTS